MQKHKNGVYYTDSAYRHIRNSDMITYKKLWHMLIELDINKSDLIKLTGISSATMAKLGRNENVNTDILQRICHSLNCDISDIMEYVGTDNTAAKHNNENE